MTTSWAEFLQRFSSPGMDTLVYIITHLGSEIFYTIALPLIYWVFSKEIGYRLGVVFLSSEFLNRYLKFFFHIPRPPATSNVRVIHPETGGGYAFPSSHAQGSTTFWGWLSREIKTRRFYWIAAFLVFLVSTSRIYLNVHWPTDILGGIGIGIVVLFLWTLVFKFYNKEKLPFSVRILGALVVPLGIYLFHSHETDLLCGLLMGMSTGRLLEEKYLGWHVKTTWLNNIFKVLLGVAGFLGIRYGLKSIFPDIGFFHVLRYAIVGLWVSFIAPLVFRKMGWEEK